ncbi:MAG: hypothetical protein APR63_04000 [Desulfuromonas sp. SDB]|nr:MAG: hypothetical protein APR63_04000 [Desulfuromonas sp. SDB]
MMKIMSLTTLLCLFFSALMSTPVDVPTSYQMVNAKLEYDGKQHDYHLEDNFILYAEDNHWVVAYVFELSPTGFIIITADDQLPPVIAYSYENDCGVRDVENNPLLNFTRADLTWKMQNFEKIPPAARSEFHNQWNDFLTGNYPDRRFFEQWPPAGSTPTGGWLMENWTQSSPYNNLCPMDTAAGSRCVAGCPAVAMGMILNFQGNINSTRFDDNDDYYHNYEQDFWIDDASETFDFPSWTQLNVYLDTLESHYQYNYPLTSVDKAALVYACGAACKQVYSASISGTWGVNQAYNAYLKFNFTNCELLDSTSDSLYERMSQNMKDAMPVHFAAIETNNAYGHNFVADGYNTDDYYHLNMGWGGTYNGWYLIPSQIPYSLTKIEGIIVDIGESQLGCQEEPMNRPNLNSIAYQIDYSSHLVQISYHIDHSSMVNLSVYNLAGQLVENILNTNQGSGSYSLKTDLSSYQNGVYIFRLSTDYSSQSLKILHLK